MLANNTRTSLVYFNIDTYIFYKVNSNSEEYLVVQYNILWIAGIKLKQQSNPTKLCLLGVKCKRQVENSLDWFCLWRCEIFSDLERERVLPDIQTEALSLQEQSQSLGDFVRGLLQHHGRVLNNNSLVRILLVPIMRCRSWYARNTLLGFFMA